MKEKRGLPRCKKTTLFLFLVSFLGLDLMALYGISATWCSHHPVTLKRTYHDEDWLQMWVAVEDERSSGGGGARGSIVDFYSAVVLLRALHL
jgi:hypothetical protein